MPLAYPNTPTRSFRQRYWLSLGITAVLFFLGYYLLSVSLSEQNAYISLMRLIHQQTHINQEIDKQILLLQDCEKEKTCTKQISNTENALEAFKNNHHNLQKRHKQLYKTKDNPYLDSLYQFYLGYYEPITSSTADFIALKKEALQSTWAGKSSQQTTRKIDLTLKKILYQEAHLTSILKDMTLAYHRDTMRYGRNIQFYQLLVLIGGLLILLAEALWLFAPIATRLEKHVTEIQQKAESERLANEKLLAFQAKIQEVNRELIAKNFEIQENNDLKKINKELEEARFFDGAISHFAEVMQWQASQTIYTWTDHLLQTLVPFFKGLQGVMYAYEQEKETLYITGSYATDQEAHLAKNENTADTNLVAQVAKSLQTIYFQDIQKTQDVPQGMWGEATAALIIQPLFFNNQLAGILEMTAPEAWEQKYIELLKRVSESIGTNLSTLQDQMRINQHFADLQMAQKKLKKSIQKIQQNEERFRKLAELTQEGLLFVHEGIIKDLNSIILPMFGYVHEKELLNTPYMPLIGSENELIADGLLHETTATRQNGETFPLEFQAREVNYGQEQMTVISLRDITIRKRTEKELEEANRIASLVEEVEKKNKGILSSIEYARRIQESILPADDVVGKGFVENFVLYMPRDIVSGDFYWFAEKGEHSLIAAVDCTGHGVPGAFMSIIGYSNLNKIVVEHGYTEPDTILRKLDKEITAILKQQDGDSESRDGMDIALCSLNIYEGVLHYAGAQRPMYLIRNGALQELKGNPYSIGGNFKFKKQKEFTKQEIPLQKDDTIYIFSDGYADQFGGLDYKKFMTKRFKELLLSLQDYTLAEQKVILKREFEIWLGNHKQMDDVMIIGLRF